MPKFERGEMVIHGRGKKREFARVVKRDPPVGYRLFTQARRQISVPARQIRRARPAVLLLESNLSSGREALRTDRQRRAGVFLEELFRTLDFTVLREKVHTPGDMEEFMAFARDNDVLFVHWSGHGAADSRTTGQHRVSGIMLRDPLYLPQDHEADLKRALETGLYHRKPFGARVRRDLENDLEQFARLRRTFRNLEGKVVVLSSCVLGKSSGLAQHVSEISGAKAVIAYDDDLTDRDANLAEAMLFTLLHTAENKRRTCGKIVGQVRTMLSEAHGQKIPLVCFERGEKTA